MGIFTLRRSSRARAALAAAHAATRDAEARIAALDEKAAELRQIAGADHAAAVRDAVAASGTEMIDALRAADAVERDAAAARRGLAAIEAERERATAALADAERGKARAVADAMLEAAEPAAERYLALWHEFTAAHDDLVGFCHAFGSIDPREVRPAGAAALEAPRFFISREMQNLVEYDPYLRHNPGRSLAAGDAARRWHALAARLAQPPAAPRSPLSRRRERPGSAPITAIMEESS